MSDIHKYPGAATVARLKPSARRISAVTLTMLRLLLLVGVAATAAGWLALQIALQLVESGLPATDLRAPSLLSRLPQASRMYSADGHLMAEYSVERRTSVAIDDLPSYVPAAFVLAEDRRFFFHEGIDYPGIARSVLANLKSGRFAQGASTITQQVAKLILLPKSKTANRKLKQMVYAQAMEKQSSKHDILQLYLNLIYFGHGTYGIEEASQRFFGVSASQLLPCQAALLACVVRSPENRSPIRHPERNTICVQNLLTELRKAGFGVESGTDSVTCSATDQRRMPAVMNPGAADLTLVSLGLLTDSDPATAGLTICSSIDSRVQSLAEAEADRLQDLVAPTWQACEHRAADSAALGGLHVCAEWVSSDDLSTGLTFTDGTRLYVGAKSSSQGAEWPEVEPRGGLYPILPLGSIPVLSPWGEEPRPFAPALTWDLAAVVVDTLSGQVLAAVGAWNGQALAVNRLVTGEFTFTLTGRPDGKPQVVSGSVLQSLDAVRLAFTGAGAASLHVARLGESGTCGSNVRATADHRPGHVQELVGQDSSGNSLLYAAVGTRFTVGFWIGSGPKPVPVSETLENHVIDAGRRLLAALSISELASEQGR